VYDEIDLCASVTRESFYEFVKRFWNTCIAEPLVDNWHIKYLCDELQTVAERVFQGLPKLYDLIINVPPGTSKSTICSVMFLPWIWTRMPQARLIGASYADNLQCDLSRACRSVIKSEKYQLCFPDIMLSDDQDAKSYFMNIFGGRRKGIGVGGIAGFHAHFIMVDDPLDPRKAISEAGVAGANWWMNNSLSMRKINKDVTATILIMQRLCQGDCTDNMIEHSVKGKIKHICLPGELTDKVNPPELKQHYQNGLLDPKRLTPSFLEEAKAKGNFLYAAQILQDPKPLGGGMFKTDRIKISDDVPTKWAGRARYWDNASTADGGAYTVGLLMGKDLQGRFWILDVVRGQWDSADREKRKKQIAEADGKIIQIGLEQEPGSGGKESAQNSVRMLAGWIVRVERPTGDKVQRADPYSVQVNNGNVYLKRAGWNTDYLGELSFFPHSTYKDQVDASSGAFTLLTKPKKKVGGLW